MYPTTEGPFDNRSTSPVNHDKWVLERRLRAIEGNNLIDLVLVVKICLVQNIVMPKEFRMLDFIKYTKLECHNTYLLSYYNKMAEMIHNNNVTTRLFKPKQRYYTHTHTHTYLTYHHIGIRWTCFLSLSRCNPYININLHHV
jgi:hypothetical protein